MTEATSETAETQEPESQLPAPAGASIDLAAMMGPEALAALERAGISPDHFRAPQPPEVTMTAWEALAVQPTKYPKASGMTRPLVFLGAEVRADEPTQAGYKGNLYVSVIDPVEGQLMVKTGYARESGELMPVSEWVTQQLERGDVFVVAKIETQRGNTVYRPINPTAWSV